MAAGIRTARHRSSLNSPTWTAVERPDRGQRPERSSSSSPSASAAESAPVEHRGADRVLVQDRRVVGEDAQRRSMLQSTSSR